MKTHEAIRLSAGAGVRNGQGFQQLEFRPAYHSLTDDSYGMLPGAEINFLNFAVRHYDGRNNYVLQKFDLVGIRSISPVNVMFRPLSYQIRAGIDRETNPDNEEEGYAFNLTAGAGGSYAFAESLKGYLLLNNHLSYGGFCRITSGWESELPQVFSASGEISALGWKRKKSMRPRLSATGQNIRRKWFTG